MRVAVTGKTGQVVTALIERGAAQGVDVVPLGRPGLDLTRPESIMAALGTSGADVIVSAAAYTAVDKAEGDAEAAFAVNAIGAGKVAQAARMLALPVVHLSTDYVFDGHKPTPYVETDAVAPIGVYGASKLAGERAVAEGTSNHAILRTSWVYSPFGSNFLKTMLRLAATQPQIRVVDDQLGKPTAALDLADAILAVATQLLRHPYESRLRGVFHVAGAGEASWAEFAEEIFHQSVVLGGPAARVEAIATAEYPTPAPRPANSRLATDKLADRYDIQLPDWRASTAVVLRRLLTATANVGSL